jgi:hypothetical protein
MYKIMYKIKHLLKYSDPLDKRIKAYITIELQNQKKVGKKFITDAEVDSLIADIFIAMENKSKEQLLIEAFYAALEVVDDAENKLGEHFKDKHLSNIYASNSIDDLKLIRTELNAMPTTAAKVMLINAIIIRENEISNKL